jgi:hypothetical protein
MGCTYIGIGQGNGAGSAIWAVVSTPVLKMMKDEGFGFMYKTSIEGTFCGLYLR